MSKRPDKRKRDAIDPVGDTKTTNLESYCPQDRSKKFKPTRDCYTVECCDERLVKSQQCLQTLIDCKRQLEDELDKCLDDIKCINERTVELECLIEKLVASQVAKECQRRMKEEICMIKVERNKTKQDLKNYRRQLYEKMERFKRCMREDKRCD
ncbi:hypothetical protein Trydic_g23888 [Trypoxylus dichotomus]